MKRETEIGVVSYKHRMPRLARICQKLGRGKEAFIPEAFTGRVACFHTSVASRNVRALGAQCLLFEATPSGVTPDDNPGKLTKLTKVPV